MALRRRGLLPDLRGRFACAADPRASEVGFTGGSATATLAEANLPPHSHTVNARTNPGSSGYFAKGDQISGGSFATSSVGNATPFSILAPFMKVRYIIKHTNG